MSLQFNVSQLLKSDVGQTRSHAFQSDEPLDLGDGEATNVRGNVKFTLTNFGILAAGEAHATLRLTCSRCLEPFEAPTDISFEEEFQPSIDVASGLPSKIAPSDTAFQVSQNHTLDLSEALRQDLLLAVELIPVCRQDCQGLCPECGANRNSEPLHAHQSDRSSPFAALQHLLTEVEIDK